MQPRGHGSQNKAAFSDQRNTLCSAAASGDQRNTTFMAFSDKRTRTALMMQTEAILKDRTQHTSKKIRNSVIDTKV